MSWATLVWLFGARNERPRRRNSWFSGLVEGLDFSRAEDGRENREFVEAAVEVSDGELGIVFGGEAPVSDLCVPDTDGWDGFVNGGLLAADFFTI
jgi:hypothetical protein